MRLRDTVIKVLITLVLLVPFMLIYQHLSKAQELPTKLTPVALGLPIGIQTPPTSPTVFPLEKPDSFALFIVEAYDKVMQVHYETRTEGEMADLFTAAYIVGSGTTSKKISLAEKSRAGFIQFLIDDFIPRKDSDKRRIAVAVVSETLARLSPSGRNSLMSERQEVALRQTVSNIDTTKDLYADIGAPKGAPAEVIEKNFAEQKVALEASTTPEAKVELAKITYAKNILTTTETKARYDTKLIEPTVFSHEIGGNILYLSISKISPTTMDEFSDALLRASSTPSLEYLVIDLRGNIGGALEFPLSFFGAYLGNGEPVITLLHQNATWTEQTITPKLPLLQRYTKQVVIVNRGTQSTAEVVAAYFKKKKLAVLIGEKTAGWGTVENTFPMQTVIDPSVKYTLFLVHSLTLADDGKPIQGRGVTPNIDVTTLGWEDKLQNSFGERGLIETLRGIMLLPPERS